MDTQVYFILRDDLLKILARSPGLAVSLVKEFSLACATSIINTPRRFPGRTPQLGRPLCPVDRPRFQDPLNIIASPRKWPR